MPAIVIGHNGRVGWGLTTANVDDQDLFIEKLDPADPSRYLTPLGYEPFEVRRVRIEVEGEAPRIETLRRTRHGPVLSPEMFGVGAVTPEGHVAALGWTALTDQDTSLTALTMLLEAGSVGDALKAIPRSLRPRRS